VDNRSGTADPVAAGVCEQLHHGRVHPYSAGDRDRCNIGQGHPGTKSLVAHGHPAVQTHGPIPLSISLLKEEKLIPILPFKGRVGVGMGHVSSLMYG